MTEKSLFVTGGASGLGLELVRAAIARGHRVCCTGRRPEVDLPSEFPDIAYLQCDMTTIEGAETVADWAIAQTGQRINCAILNAGAGYFRPLIMETETTISQILTLNLEANVVLAHKLFPALGGGVLAMIGSVAYKGAAGMPLYASSKGALDGFGRALSEEWRGRTCVRVLHPGPCATGMSERAGRTRNALDRFFISPQQMAEAILEASLAMSGPDRQVISWGRVLRRQMGFRLREGDA